MSKLSKTVIDKSSSKSTSNLNDKVKRREEIPLMSALVELCRMPKKKKVVGRYLGLFQDGMKDKTKRIAEIVGELLSLRQKLNFPNVSKQQIHAKVSQLVNGYISYQKKVKKFEKDLENVFDFTKIDGFWLCKAVSSVAKRTLSVREVWGSIPGLVKSAQCRQRLAIIATFLRSCVALALSRGDGPRHLLHASA